MLRQWLRTASAWIRIPMRFTGVICVNGTQSISFDSTGRAEVATKRSLVFLESPAAGDLRDTYAHGAGRTVSYTSPDAIELLREEKSGRLTISWLPRDPVTLFALYEHQNTWSTSTTPNESAVCAEYECDMRTGIFTIELVASSTLEAAVLFRRPRWPWRQGERAVVRAALKRLPGHESSTRLADDGTRVTSELRSPRVGQRYLLVAFGKYGAAACEQWLQQTSLFGRLKGLFGRLPVRPSPVAGLLRGR